MNAAKWKRLMVTTAIGTKEWEGEYIVTVDGIDFRAYRDTSSLTYGSYRFTFASDTTTCLLDDGTHGSWSRADCVDEMRKVIARLDAYMSVRP